MRWKPTTLALAGLLAGGLTARADDYDRFYAAKLKIDPAHSVIGFAVPFMGLSKTEGRFDEFAGTLMFDEADPTRSSVSVVIKAASLDTNSEARDKDLQSDAFTVEQLIGVERRLALQGQRTTVDGLPSFKIGEMEVLAPGRNVQVSPRQPYLCLGSPAHGPVAEPLQPKRFQVRL